MNIFQKAWRLVDTKKLWTIISIVVGYGLAQAQINFPNFHYWDLIYQILAALGLTVAGGHRILKNIPNETLPALLQTRLDPNGKAKDPAPEGSSAQDVKAAAVQKVETTFEKSVSDDLPHNNS